MENKKENENQNFRKTFIYDFTDKLNSSGNQIAWQADSEGKHGHERYGEDGIVFHKDTIILISSMIIMIIVGKLN